MAKNNVGQTVVLSMGKSYPIGAAACRLESTGFNVRIDSGERRRRGFTGRR